MANRTRDAAFECMTEAVVILDTQGRVVDVNPAARKILGTSEGTILVGQPMARLLPGWTGLAGDETPSTGTAEVRAGKDQRLQWLEVRVSPFLAGSNDESALAGHLVVLRDITDHKIALQEVYTRNRELDVLNRVGQALLNAGLNRERLLQTLCQSVSELYAYERVNVHLLEADGKLYARAFSGWTEDDKTIAAVIPLDRGVVGRAARTRQPQFVPDVTADADFMGGTGEIQSEICVPIEVEGRLLGTLNVESTRATRALDTSDFRLLTILAAQAAVILENARLYTDRLRALNDLETLQSMGQKLAATLDVQTVVRYLANGARVLTSAMNGGVLIQDPVTKEFVRVIDLDPSAPHQDEVCRYVTRPGGLTDYMWKHAEPIYIADTVADPRVRREIVDRGVRSTLMVPMFWSNKPVGCLFADSHKADAFTDNDRQLLQTLAMHGASALENARLVEALSTANAELEERVSQRTAELQVALEQAQAADRAKSVFLAHMGHELRTPLANIVTYTDLLQHGKPEKRESYLGTLKEEAHRLQTLVVGVLNLTALEGGQVTLKLEAVDANMLVADLLHDRVRQAMRCGLTLTSDLAPQLPLVRADPVWLARAVQALLDNALVYTYAGGRIAVYTRQSAGGVAIEVRDTGPGIPQEEQAHIFERFYRGAAYRSGYVSGTGLGLAMCKEIAERHHGTITVESPEGLGSSFTLWLPGSQ